MRSMLLPLLQEHKARVAANGTSGKAAGHLVEEEADEDDDSEGDEGEEDDGEASGSEEDDGEEPEGREFSDMDSDEDNEADDDDEEDLVAEQAQPRLPLSSCSARSAAALTAASSLAFPFESHISSDSCHAVQVILHSICLSAHSVCTTLEGNRVLRMAAGIQGWPKTQGGGTGSGAGQQEGRCRRRQAAAEAGQGANAAGGKDAGLCQDAGRCNDPRCQDAWHCHRQGARLGEGSCRRPRHKAEHRHENAGDAGVEACRSSPPSCPIAHRHALHALLAFMPLSEDGLVSASLKPIGRTWYCLTCRIGHFDSCIGSHE
jgi:hypothetical protein